MEKDSTTFIGIYVGSEFGILKDQFITLDHRFNIGSDQSSLNQIVIKEHADHIPNFFGKRVTQVSGIVGKNGVGKSTLLRYVKELFIRENRDTASFLKKLIFPVSKFSRRIVSVHLFFLWGKLYFRESV